MHQKYDTRYYKLEELCQNAQKGDTPDCVYITIPSADVWDFFTQIMKHLRDESMLDLELCFSGTLKECGLWGTPLPPAENK